MSKKNASHNSNHTAHHSSHHSSTVSPGQIIGVASAVAIAAGLLFIVPKIGQAANLSRPGDLLFPLDQVLEHTQKTFTADPAEAARQALQRANERQNEAESLVIEASQMSCQENQAAQLSDPQLIKNLTVAFNGFATELNEVESKALQLRNNSQAYENILAGIVETNLHHLLIWESMSKLVPLEAGGTLTKTVELMNQSTQKALAALPAGRKSDLASEIQGDSTIISANVGKLLAVCRSATTNTADLTISPTVTGTGSNTNTTNTTTQTGTTGTNGTTSRTNADSVSSTTRTILQQIASPTTPPQPQPTSRPNPGNPTPVPTSTPNNPDNPLSILDIGLGSDELGSSLGVNNIIDLNNDDGNGIGIHPTIDANTEENTTGCNGITLLGACIGN